MLYYTVPGGCGPCSVDWAMGYALDVESWHLGTPRIITVLALRSGWVYLRVRQYISVSRSMPLGEEWIEREG